MLRNNLVTGWSVSGGGLHKLELSSLEAIQSTLVAILIEPMEYTFGNNHHLDLP